MTGAYYFRGISMKAISTTVVLALLGFAVPAYAADEFVDACMLGASAGTDMAKTCACM